MNTTFITLIIAALVGTALSVGGAYITIDNLANPKGYLFEGIVLGSIGLLTILMVTIAIAIGKTIQTFGEVMKNQADLQREIQTQAVGRMSQPGGSLGSMIANMMQNPGSQKGITIDLSGNPDNTSLSDAFKNLVKQYPEGSLEGLGIDDLEKELAKAIKTDDYERAADINKAIKKIKNLGDDQDEKKEE